LQLARRLTRGVSKCSALDKDGKVATNNGFPLIAKVTPTIVNAVVKSPLFQNWSYTSGVGQINDQLMRAQFWNRIGHDDGSEGGGHWHTLLAPRVQTTRTMSIPFGSWAFTPNDNGSCCLAVFLDENAFVSQFFRRRFPWTTPRSSGPLNSWAM
jgi:hypothetical protein